MQTNNRFHVHQNTDRLALRNSFLNLYPSSFFTELKHYPNLQISFSESSEKKLKDQVVKAERAGFSLAKQKQYVPALICFKGKNDSASIKLHGTTSGNFIGSKKSWSIKADKQKFNLITPKQHHYLVPIYANFVAKQLKLYYNEQELVLADIDNDVAGLYWKEEKINQQFLEKRGLEECVVVALNNSWIDATKNGDWEKVCQPENIKRNNKKEMQQAIADYGRLIKAIEEKQTDSLLQFFNIKYLARYEAYRNLLGVCHDIVGDNLRLIYNNKTHKFYPIVRSEGDLNMISIKGGTTWHSYNSYGSREVKRHHYMQLFALLNNKEEFGRIKNESLQAILKNKTKILSALNSLHKTHYDAVCYDRNDYHSIREKKILLPDYFSRLLHNFTTIEKTLKPNDKEVRN